MGLHDSGLSLALSYLAPAITECVPISAFVYLDSISIGIRSSAVGLTIYATTAAIKK